MQVEEIIRSANLDSSEVTRMVSALNQMLSAKDDVLKDLKFGVVKLQKTYNDTRDAFLAKMKEFGIPQEEIDGEMFRVEQLPAGATTGPASTLIAKM